MPQSYKLRMFMTQQQRTNDLISIISILKTDIWVSLIEKFYGLLSRESNYIWNVWTSLPPHWHHLSYLIGRIYRSRNMNVKTYDNKFICLSSLAFQFIADRNRYESKWLKIDKNLQISQQKSHLMPLKNFERQILVRKSNLRTWRWWRWWWKKKKLRI